MFFIASVYQSTQIRIENFHANIILTNNGSMEVEETWIVNYPANKSVSFRDIAYQKYNPDNPLYQSQSNTASFDEESVSVEVYNANGVALSPSQYRVGYSFKGELDELDEPIQCEPSRQSCESIFVHVPSGMDRQMTFKYQYTIQGAVTKYRDISELNWNFIEYFGSEIKNASISINIAGVNEDDIFAWGYGLSRGTIEIVDENVYLDMKRIKQGDNIEFRILMPAETFNVANKNFIDRQMREEIFAYSQKLADETNMRITIARVIFGAMFAMVILMGVITYYVYLKYDKEHIPQFTGKYYRELPADYTPAEMSYLYYFRSINNEDVTATLLDLVRRGYLHLDTGKSKINEKDPDFIISLNKETNLKELLSHEKHLIDWFIGIIGNGSEVTIKQIENYPKGSYQKAMKFQEQAKLFVNKAKEAGSKHDFFEPQLSGSKGVVSLWVLIPLGFLLISLSLQTTHNIDNSIPMLVSLAVMIIYLVYIASIKKRSVKGNEDFVKWKAFRDFLLDFGNLKDYPMPGVVVWEHFLVYATSLKVADKVMQQLEVRLPREEITSTQSTYLGFGYRYYGFHLGYTLGRINNSVTTARANGNATIAAHNAARVSAGGRGGGFGGGRSFGGGGGGFRGR